MRCNWKPHTVKDPSSGHPFTEAAAWEFIADQLEAQTPLEEKLLDQPAGAVAYVMKVSMGCGQPMLYVKLQLGRETVIGRSFHCSTRQSRLPIL
jgi:hypothetical protein